MDATHLHLLVNHLPIVGTFLAVPLLLLALARRADVGALHAAALVLVLAGGGAVVADETGEGAEEGVEHLAGTDESAIETHEERAAVAVPVAVVTALFALGTVAARTFRPGTLSTVATVVTLASTTGSAGVMAWVGQSGGLIRHSELRDVKPPAPTVDRIGDQAREHDGVADDD